MLLGIVLHIELAYITQPIKFWAVNDPSTSRVFDISFFAIHTFRMQLFFLMAGFFACMLCDRGGPGGFAMHRLRRIGLPLLASMVLILPLCHLAFRAGHHQRGLELRGWPPLDSLMHLWFLQQLLIMCLVAAAWSWATNRSQGVRAFSGRVVVATRWATRRHLLALLIGLLTVPSLLADSSIGVGTQSRGFPPLPVLVTYSLYFASGWLLYRVRDVLDAVRRGWWACSLIAWVVLYPALLWQVRAAAPDTTELYPASSRTIQLLSAFQNAFAVIGLTGVFLRWFARPSRVMRYVSDSAYWVYLLHLPLVIAGCMLVVEWPVAAEVKFTVVLIASCAVLLGSYHLLCRNTVIGVFLNGRRARDRGSRSLADAERGKDPPDHVVG